MAGDARIRVVASVLLLGFFATGCGSDESSDQDASAVDSQSDGSMVDAGDGVPGDGWLPDSAGTDNIQPVDTETNDSQPGDSVTGDGFADGGGDATLLPCGQQCGVDATCWEGVCVRECKSGLSVEELDVQLAPDIEIVANFCTDTAPIQAFAVLPSYEVLEVRAKSKDGETNLMLRKWPLYLKDGPDAGETLASTNLAGTLEAWDVLPAPFVAYAPARALWGYTTVSSGLGGEVWNVGLTPPNDVASFEAAGIAGGELLSDDEMLAYSFGFGSVDSGLGLYLHRISEEKTVRVIDDLGDTSGHVVRVGESLLVTGYSDAWLPCDGQNQGPEAGRRVFVLSVEKIHEAFENQQTIHARCDAKRLDISDAFVGLGDGFVLTQPKDNAFADTGLLLHTLETDGDTGSASLSSGVPVTQGNAFVGGRKMAGADVLLLQHEGGFLMVRAAFLTADTE